MNRRNRVGPFRVLKRYKGAGRDVGRVYEALEEKSGRPAVLVVPGREGEWHAAAGWQVTAATEAGPERMSLRVDGAPAGATISELTTMLLRLALAVGDLAKRPDALAHLTAAYQPRGRAGWRWAPAAVALAVAVAVLLVPLSWGPERPPELLPVGSVPVGALTGGELAAAWPPRPFDNQKRPPCDAGLEHELSGGCWVRLDVVAPCPERAYERGGRCYLPAVPAPKPGRSVQPRP